MAKRMATKVYKFFRTVGIVGYNSKKNVFGIHPLVVSTGFMIISIIIMSSLRKCIKNLLGDNIFRDVLLEIFTTMEMCIAFFELIIITEHWGIWAYALYLFLLTLLWEKTWTDASACPYSPLEEVLEGQREYSTAALQVFGQILGALLTFSYVQIFWAMELIHTHRGKAFEDCTADLQVPMIPGAVIEAVGTCLCRLVARSLALVDTTWASILNAFCSTMIVVAAFDTSGGYFNPALATSLKLGCEGNTFIEHAVVYWVGAIIGAVLSVYIFRSKVIQDHLKNIGSTKTE